jgi:hypothetical protein
VPSRLLLGYIDRKRKERKCIAVFIDSKRTLILHPLSATATPTLFFSPPAVSPLYRTSTSDARQIDIFLSDQLFYLFFGYFLGGRKNTKFVIFVTWCLSIMDRIFFLNFILPGSFNSGIY